MKRDPAAWRRLSETIRAHRTRKGWSQAELAQHAGISTKSALTAESGKPPTRMPPSMARIAEALGWADGSIDRILDGGDPITAISSLPPSTSQGPLLTITGPPGTGKSETVAAAIEEARRKGHTILVTSSKPGSAFAAMRGASELSRICAELGADSELVADFDAAAETLLASAMLAQTRTTEPAPEHFAAVAHSPRSDGGPESDRAIVDETVRRFREERQRAE